MVLNELIFHSFYCSEGVVILKELISNSFYCWDGCGHLEGTDF